jgi:prephenate dehydratase
MDAAAYQGQPGAYSEGAARRLCGVDARLLPCDTLRDAFDAVANGLAESAVVPIENTLAGAVPGALALLLGRDLVVHGETTEHIDHVLAAPPGATLNGLREILSHPVALAQCERFLRAQPGVRAVPVFDTAGALRMVMDASEPARAAIASQAAAALYQAVVLAEHIQDHRENYTRFLRLAPPPGPIVTTRPCRIMLGVRLPHQPGSLAGFLQSTASFDINLTRLDCAPVPGRPFEYEFFLEGVLGHAAPIETVLETLGRHGDVRLLGCLGDQAH